MVTSLCKVFSFKTGGKKEKLQQYQNSDNDDNDDNDVKVIELCNVFK